MRNGVVLALVVATVALCGCSSSSSKPETPQHITTYQLPSKLLHRRLDQILVTPVGGGKGRPLLVFLHGYGGTPVDTLGPAFVEALRKLGDRAPVVVLPDGQTGWWHDRDEGRWGSYVLKEVIPAALARSGADAHKVAVGGISMGGFGALNLGRHEGLFCAVGGHSPAVLEEDNFSFGFDNSADFTRNDLITIAKKRSPYDSPVWIDVGDQDELRPADRLLAKELRARGADVTFHIWPGSHDGDYWNKHFDEYVKFYADACD
jgi:S-formylglutathione hydrolase FrmB